MTVEELKQWIEQEQLGKCFLQESMQKHTSFRIGGPADCLVVPASNAAVVKILAEVARRKLPLTVMGNGSNMLVRDKGIRGVVLKLGNACRAISCQGTTVIAESGASLAAVSNFAAKQELTGMEFAVGIPGSLGGAVFMNAGAYDGEMSKVVRSVEAVDLAGQTRHFTAEELGFGYRHSALQDNGYLALTVTMELKQGAPAAIAEKMADFTQRRTTKQPLDIPNAGSMFKRPVGYYAGTLIQEAGLKGFSVGDAQVSPKHAGFVVNNGKATAAEVLALIAAVQEKVYAHAGVHLEAEVRVVGEE